MSSVEPTPGFVQDPYELSYQASSLDKTGRIISKEKKRAIREKRKPQTIEGQSLNGWCVKCNPALNRDHSKRELTGARKQSSTGSDPLQRGSDHSGRSGRSEFSGRSSRSDATPRSVSSATSAPSCPTPNKNFITVQARPAIGRSVDRAVSESRLGPVFRTPEPRQNSFNSAARVIPKPELSESGSIRSWDSPHSGVPRHVVKSAVPSRHSSLVSQSSDSEVSNRSGDVMMERQSSLRNFTPNNRPSRLNSTDKELSLRSIGSLSSSHSFQQESFKDRPPSRNSLGARQSSQRSFLMEGHSSLQSAGSSESLSGHHELRQVNSQISLEQYSSYLNTNTRNTSLNRNDSGDSSDEGFRKTWKGGRVRSQRSLSSELTELPSNSEESYIQDRDPAIVQTAGRRRAPRNPSFARRPDAPLSRRLSSRTNSSRSIGSFDSDEDYNRRSPASQDDASVLLGNVENLLSDLKNVQDPELIIDVLVDSMDSHVKVEEIQCLCIGRIAELFSDMSVDCTQLFTANGHKSILAAMNNFPSSLCVQEKGLEALVSLALRENAREMLVQEGVCTIIDNALHRFLAEEKMIVCAVKALRALSCDREGAERMEELRMSETVVEVMHCNMMSVSIQRDGCSLLSNLVVDADNQQVAQVDKSALLVIEAAMREHQEDSTVQASACFALKNLSFEQKNLRMISKSESVLELLMKAQEFASAREDAMLLIERIQICSAEDQSLEDQVCESLHLLVEARSGQPEVVDDLMETIEAYEWSERITFTCIDILAAMVTESEQYRRKLSGKQQMERLEMCARSSTFSDALLQETHHLIGLVRESS